MDQIADQKTLLALNSTEWLNLCARGSIRISRRRPVQVSTQPSEKEMEKVFVTAPFTKVDSSVDLFVLEITDSWTKSAQKHRSFPSEISILSLSDVLSHYPISQAHYEHYKSKGASCGVELQEAKFEQYWGKWTLNEKVKDALESAAQLQKAFGIGLSIATKRPDKYKWEDLARLSLRPNEQIKLKPSHVETLISGARKLADAVATTVDSEQFYIACAIEWIDLRLKKDPMKKKGTRELLRASLEKTKELPLGDPGPETLSALDHLYATYPKAFTEEIPPLAIAHVIRLMNAARTKKLKPEVATHILNSATKSSSTATLLSFLLALALDVELTSQLVMATSTLDFAEMTWDLPN
jgi:hypothetical protein